VYREIYPSSHCLSLPKKRIGGRIDDISPRKIQRPFIPESTSSPCTQIDYRLLASKQAIQEITEYIEIFYNRQRKQERLGYLPPEQFSQRYYVNLLAA
jgi:transposase InsO family protein